MSEQENRAGSLKVEDTNNGLTTTYPITGADSIAKTDVPETPAVTPTGEQTRDIFIEPTKEPRPDSVRLQVPNETRNETVDKLNQMPNQDYAKSESGRKFMESFRESLFMLPAASWYSEVTYRPGSFWMQEVPSENGKLAASTRNWLAGDGKKLTGEAAMMRMRQATGQGTTFSFPLYHTGIWVTLMAPEETELVELERRLTEEKANLGRATHGVVFGNNSAIFAGILADFVIDHIHDSNLIENERSYHQVISCLDLPILIWGLAYTIWPQGFPYSRTKIKPEDGSYIEESGLLKLGGLQITDNLALTDRQRNHMAKQRGQKVNLETIRLYREQFLRGATRRVTVNENLAFELAVPSIADYLESGNKWVNGISTMVDKALGLAANETKRIEHIEKLGKATNVRQFGHWVKAIHLGSDVIDDREDIDNNLDVYSGSDEHNEAFFDHIQKFAEDSTISVVAVTRGDYDESSNKMQQFPNYLVLDTMSTFFILLLQKVARLGLRD